MSNKQYKLKITDTSLRDAQQSMWGKLFSVDEIVPILADLDECGFDALEVWGGGIFETSLKFGKENPWERLKKIKKNIKQTPLQMIIRGKNLVGYHPYSDEIIENFLNKSFDLGISIIRIFDPINDIENIKNVIKFSKSKNVNVQGVMCYTIAPSYDLDFFVNYAKQLKDEGVNGLTIKDPAGMLLPDVAVELVKRLQKEVKLPVNLHSHITNGIVNVTYFEAIKNHIDGIDCSLDPLSFPAAQPSIENILTLFAKEKDIFNVNQEKILSVSNAFANLSYQKEVTKPCFPINSQTIFANQLTRGSFTFLYEQLKKRNVLNKLPKVLDEISAVRQDLGNPPMIIPISQIIIAQSVYNVLMEKRYKLIPREIKDFVKGVYGKTLNPISEELLEIINKEKNILNHNNNQEINYITSLSSVRNQIPEELVEDESDYLTYAIFPELALEYFKYRKNPNDLANNPPLSRPISTEEEILVLNKLMIDKNVIEFELNEENHYISIKKFSADMKEGNYTYMPRGSAVSPNSQNQNINNSQDKQDNKKTEEKIKRDTISSPIVGVFYSKPKPDANSYVKKGDTVSEGDTVCIIEAMKVMNEIKAPFNCKILDVLIKEKETVDPQQDLFVVEKI
jgi:oxaloacetate decarboxylase alpha subunit